MTVAQGTNCYTLGAAPCSGAGVSWTAAELDGAINGPVASIVFDDSGKANVGALLSSLADTQFQKDGVARILANADAVEDWRVGEAIAESYVIKHRAGHFPWPDGRDERKRGLSLPGADLVGFRGPTNNACFAFCEVKTSGENKHPPGAMFGRTGLKQQLEDLRDDKTIRDDLVPSSRYGITQLIPNMQYIVRIPNVIGGSKQSVLGANALTIPNAGGGTPGTQADVRDSDGLLVGNDAEVSVLTTDIAVAGANNHNFDFGFGQVLTCSVSIDASPSTCNPSNNQYSVSGTINFSNAPASGVLTVSVGSVNQSFNPPFASPLTYTLNGLTSDRVSHTVNAVFSADTLCKSSAIYAAPPLCYQADCSCSEYIYLNEPGANTIMKFKAIESYWLDSRSPLLHGEAIAIGMVSEAFLSHRLGNISENELFDIRHAIVKMYGHHPKYVKPSEEILNILKVDKKNQKGEYRFALLKSVGKACFDVPVSSEHVEESLLFYKEKL